MKLRVAFGMFCLAVLGNAGSFQSYRLARIPKVGQELHYQLIADIDVLGDTTTITALVIETITSVENGKFTIESIQTKARAKAGALEKDLPDSERSSAVYLLSGEPIEIKAGNEGGAQGRLARMNAFVSPNKEVKIGDKWTHNFSSSPLSGGVGGKVEYKALAIEKVGEKTGIVIQFDFKETAKSKPAESNGKVWIDAGSGELLKLEAIWKNAVMLSPDAPMDARINLVRVG